MLMKTDIDVIAPPIVALKALAEPLRWSIVTALAREELCVCHLTEDLGRAQPLVSHHLRVLRDAGIVESEKWRYWTYYRLAPTRLRSSRISSRPSRRPADRRATGAGPAADATRSRAPSSPSFVGTAMLVAVVVGSGIAAQRLSPGDVGLAAVRERGGDRGRD